MTLRTLVLLAIAVAGCDSTAPSGPPCANPDGGSFTGSAVDIGNLAGCASYAITSSSGSPAMGLVISTGPLTSPTLVVNLGRLGDRPAPGTYNVGTGAGEFIGSIILNPGSQSFSLVSGAITIDVSTLAGMDGTLVGSLNVTATRAGAGGSVILTGNFTAVCSVGGNASC
jgi:hypothetical protein